MRRSSWLLSAALVASLSFGGCSQPPVEHTVRKVPTEDVRGDAEQAADTATKAATQAKEDFQKRLETGLADLDAKIARLHEKGLALQDEARDRWDARMADLEEKQKAARTKLDELGKSTGEAWERLERGAQSAWEDLQKAFQEATKEL